MQLSTFALFTITLSMLSACVPGERVAHVRPVHAGTPRDEHALTAAAAGGHAVRAWEAASRRALRSGLTIATTFHERIRFPADEPYAVAYRLSLASGQSVRIRIDAAADERIFADVFQPITDDMFRHVFAPRDATQEFAFRAPIAGEYALRLQPPIGAGGFFEVTVTTDMALVFPVAGASMAAIGGTFGDARDGGARAHEGVDIFAPRGTPVVAVAAGRVNGVRTTPTGGRVVWLADDAHSLTYYYAHLDEQYVRDGMFVSAGDTLGTVGNTGNAAGISPHLHFGVYRPGTVAVDPAPYLGSEAPVGVHIDTTLLGQWVQLAGNRVRLRNSPSPGGSIVAELRDGTALLILGAIGAWHRVVLPDGTTGFVAARFTVAQPGSR